MSPHGRRSLFGTLIVSIVSSNLLLGVAIVLFHLSHYHRQAVPAGTVLIEAIVWWSITLGVNLLVISLAIRSHRRELSRLAHGARLFARGKLDRHIDRPDAAELLPLSQALNDMAQRVARTIEDLNAQRADQQSILRSMKTGVIALAPDATILNCNRAAKALFDVADDPSGRLFHEVVRHIDLHRLINQSLAGERPDSMELTLADANGTRVVATTLPLLNLDNSVRGVLLMLEDVTTLRKLETMRSDFAANVSHELRTPITNIKGYIETLQHAWRDDPDQTDRFLSVLSRNTLRLEHIVDDILALTQLENTFASDRPDPERLVVEQLFSMIIHRFKAAAAAKAITLTIDCPSDLAVPGHRTLLEQALANLVDNAIAYSPSDTTITLKGCLASDRTHIELMVIDQGPGIDVVHRERIFERFYRIDKGRSRAAGGTGLGLAIVKHIALAHGGSVEVRDVPNEAASQATGSCFCLTLPCSNTSADNHTNPT